MRINIYLLLVASIFIYAFDIVLNCLEALDRILIFEICVILLWTLISLFLIVLYRSLIWKTAASRKKLLIYAHI